MRIKELLIWYRNNARDLPWRKTKNPYNVWLSEIILQQTRVNQGLPYYESFIRSYPTVKGLALAKEEEVMRLWQGLGYYSRARNLLFTAKTIHFDYDGEFPKSYKELLKLKGIGPYTAAAISSICFDEPVAVVDGNVYRVLSRVYNSPTPINSNEGIKKFKEIANTLVPQKKPGDFNQAMMELGALICTPKSPKCLLCPMKDQCAALAHKTISQLPVKLKKNNIKERYLHYFIKIEQGAIYMQKRNTTDIWGNLYEFPLLELSKDEMPQESHRLKLVDVVEHKLTHQLLKVYFWKIEGAYKVVSFAKKFSKEEVELLPKPKVIVNYLTKNKDIWQD